MSKPATEAVHHVESWVPDMDRITAQGADCSAGLDTAVPELARGLSRKRAEISPPGDGAELISHG